MGSLIFFSEDAMKHLMLAVALCLTAATAHATSRELTSCDKGWGVEQSALSTTAATEFSTATAAGVAFKERRLVEICNADATAANQVWVSSFNVTTLVSGVLDSSKATPIPGGTSAADACKRWAWGPNVRFWLFRVITSTAKAIVTSCE
jgi:hypothetical protein